MTKSKHLSSLVFFTANLWLCDPLSWVSALLSDPEFKVPLLCQRRMRIRVKGFSTLLEIIFSTGEFFLYWRIFSWNALEILGHNRSSTALKFCFLSTAMEIFFNCIGDFFNCTGDLFTCTGDFFNCTGDFRPQSVFNALEIFSTALEIRSLLCHWRLGHSVRACHFLEDVIVTREELPGWFFFWRKTELNCWQSWRIWGRWTHKTLQTARKVRTSKQRGEAVNIVMFWKYPETLKIQIRCHSRLKNIQVCSGPDQSFTAKLEIGDLSSFHSVRLKKGKIFVIISILQQNVYL